MISNNKKAEAKKLLKALIKKVESHIKKIKEAMEDINFNNFDKYPLNSYLKKAEKLRQSYIMAYKEIDKQGSDFDFKALFKNKLKELPKVYTSQQIKQVQFSNGVVRIKRLHEYDLGMVHVEFLGGNRFEKKMEA